jgi:hypothetical protein
MDFSIKERYLLLSILPDKGDFRTMKTIQDLRTDLLFSSEEVARCKIVQDGNKLTWDTEAEEPFSITVNDLASEILATALKGLDDEKTLTADYILVYERFVKSDDETT